MKTAVIVALLVAVGLAFATLVALRRPATTPQPPVAWLADLSEQSVDAVRFSWGEKSGEIRIAGDGRGGWTMEWTGPDGPVTWPVQSAQVRGAMRLLADLAPMKHSTDALIRETPTTLISFSKGAREVGSLRIATKGLGGQVPAIINDAQPRFVFIEEALSRAFLREGVLQWRTALVMPGIAQGPTSVRISNPVSSVELARAAGRWAVREPWQTPAADGPMKQLLATFATVPVTRFADDASAEDAKLGFGAAGTSLRVESPLLTGDASGRERLVERTEIGGPADVARGSLFVRASAAIEREGGESKRIWGPIVLVVDRSRLDAIAGDPSVYASKAVLRASALDVVRVAIANPKGERAAFTRTIDGWFGADADGKPSAKVDGERVKAIQQLVEILCGERATEVRGDVGLDVAGTVEAGVAEGPLPTVEVVQGDIGGKARIGLRVKGVTRLYAEGEQATLRSTFATLGER